MVREDCEHLDVIQCFLAIDAIHGITTQYTVRLFTQDVESLSFILSHPKLCLDKIWFIQEALKACGSSDIGFTEHRFRYLMSLVKATPSDGAEACYTDHTGLSKMLVYPFIDPAWHAAFFCRVQSERTNALESDHYFTVIEMILKGFVDIHLLDDRMLEKVVFVKGNKHLLHLVRHSRAFDAGICNKSLLLAFNGCCKSVFCLLSEPNVDPMALASSDLLSPIVKRDARYVFHVLNHPRICGNFVEFSVCSRSIDMEFANEHMIDQSSSQKLCLMCWIRFSLLPRNLSSHDFEQLILLSSLESVSDVERLKFLDFLWDDFTTGVVNETVIRFRKGHITTAFRACLYSALNFARDVGRIDVIDLWLTSAADHGLRLPIGFLPITMQYGAEKLIVTSLGALHSCHHSKLKDITSLIFLSTIRRNDPGILKLLLSHKAIATIASTLTENACRQCLDINPALSNMILQNPSFRHLVHLNGISRKWSRASEALLEECNLGKNQVLRDHRIQTMFAEDDDEVIILMLRDDAVFRFNIAGPILVQAFIRRKMNIVDAYLTHIHVDPLVLASESLLHKVCLVDVKCVMEVLVHSRLTGLAIFKKFARMVSWDKTHILDVALSFEGFSMADVTLPITNESQITIGSLSAEGETTEFLFTERYRWMRKTLFGKKLNPQQLFKLLQFAFVQERLLAESEDEREVLRLSILDECEEEHLNVILQVLPRIDVIEAMSNAVEFAHRRGQTEFVKICLHHKEGQMRFNTFPAIAEFGTLVDVKSMTSTLPSSGFHMDRSSTRIMIEALQAAMRRNDLGILKEILESKVWSQLARFFTAEQLRSCFVYSPLGVLYVMNHASFKHLRNFKSPCMDGDGMDTSDASDIGSSNDGGGLDDATDVESLYSPI
ncbi:hypothetical protein BC829DRAFT_383682 [Chytridium lagenaria]|nr:hypothetical protein BC829DRAFT_383682 [Chytridium lagenaria]